MEILRDPNRYSQVKLLNNPLKSVTCKQKFTNQDTVSDCKVFPELLDLGCGVWQVAVQSVLIVNRTPRFPNNEPFKTVFDIKTNLTSSYKQVEGAAVAIDETLCSFPVVLQALNEFVMFDPPTKIFFTLDSRPTDTFRIYFFVNELLKTPGLVYQFDVQIRLLFQRML
jgi:hypothetical protein